MAPEATTGEAPAQAAQTPPAPVKAKPPLMDERMLLLAGLLFLFPLMAFPRLNNFLAVQADTFMSRFRRTPPTDQQQWIVGNTAVVDLTVVTADVWRLGCASDQVIDGAHCGYKQDQTRWESAPGEPLDDNLINTIQPFRTENGNLLISVVGLWAQPEIAMRVHQEPPRLVQEKRQKRFTARCEVKFIGTLEKPKLQWNPSTKKWFDEGNVVVARAQKCSLKLDQ